MAPNTIQNKTKREKIQTRSQFNLLPIKMLIQPKMFTPNNMQTLLDVFTITKIRPHVRHIYKNIDQRSSLAISLIGEGTFLNTIR